MLDVVHELKCMQYFELQVVLCGIVVVAHIHHPCWQHWCVVLNGKI
jgi:hypothetical protein